MERKDRERDGGYRSVIFYLEAQTDQVHTVIIAGAKIC
jgi:hypothetical protein